MGGSGTLNALKKSVILVENHPQKRMFGWLIITP